MVVLKQQAVQLVALFQINPGSDNNLGNFSRFYCFLDKATLLIGCSAINGASVQLGFCNL